MEQLPQISFTGEYNYSIDSKNRLNIPSKFRKALNPVNNNTFVITRGFDRCLVLYPFDEWQKVEGQLGILTSIKQMNRDFVRSIVRHAVYVQYDSQGRVQIPDSLLGYAGIEKDVSIIGMIKKIEVWEPGILQIHEEANSELDQKSFENLADDINF